jgi:hypothetical protein
MTTFSSFTVHEVVVGQIEGKETEIVELVNLPRNYVSFDIEAYPIVMVGISQTQQEMNTL